MIKGWGIFTLFCTQYSPYNSIYIDLLDKLFYWIFYANGKKNDYINDGKIKRNEFRLAIKFQAI